MIGRLVGSVPVIIDDVDSALGCLDEWGRWVLHAPAQTVRMAITMCASSRRWLTLEHRSAAEWAQQMMRRDHVWLILDPLICTAGPDRHRVGVSRIASSQGWQFSVELDPALRRIVAGSTVGLIDDFAGTGRTLLDTAAAVQHAGGRVVEFVVAASSDLARSRLRAEYGAGCFKQFLPGDSGAIHLRDCCPALPRAGRRIAGIQPVRIGDQLVEVRLPPNVVRGGMWESVFNDRSIHHLLIEARKQLVLRFAQALGRPAILSDLLLLNADVAVPLWTRVEPSADTLLERVLLHRD